MTALFEAPTVAGLIGQLGLSSMRAALGVLLTIRPQGSKPPLFGIHPAGGISWCYMPLVRYIPDSTHSTACRHADSMVQVSFPARSGIWQPITSSRFDPYKNAVRIICLGQLLVASLLTE